MFELLKQINQRPEVWEVYTAETLWNDKHISLKMLEFHLNEKIDPASRNKTFLDKSVAWMISRFDIGPGTTICDFGCGPGLYTTQFAEQGASVSGVDFSERSIQYAKEIAAKKQFDIDYTFQNYLSFTTKKRFDLISLIYCDYCALSPVQRKTLLGRFYDCLDDRGSIVLDAFSLHAFEEREEAATCEHLLLDGFWSADDYFGYMNTFKYEREKVVLDKYTIIEKSRTWEVYNWLQYFSLESLKNEFEENGFRIVDQYSDVAGQPYTPNSKEIAAVASKII
jgi:cyclopropane fatty-acyl-phospholipid synthase-like methyltransferase